MASAAAQQPADADLGRGDQRRLVDLRGDQHDPGLVASAERPNDAGGLLVQLVGDHHCHRGLVDVELLDDADLGSRPQLTHHPGQRDRVGAVDIGLDRD